jgi:phosphate-selective porin OprO/OprP
MEPALPYVFAPDRNVGMMVMNTFCKDRGTWALGVFRETNDAPTVSSDRGYALTGRVTGLPWYENKGEKLLHVGMAASLRKQPFDTLQLQQRPEFHLAPYLASTPAFTAERQGLIDPEIALVCGPFAMQSEYMQDFVTGTSHGNDVNFHGFYIEGTCFLTGEHRPYDVKAGLFARVIPKNNFSPRTGGLGAWQIAARYSTLDLTNDGITGNTMQDFTLGVN